ncbi:MAG TPA: M28 family peptidase [Gemmatimonadaceae bacterium]|nr:M28 family peptidase [Gemmatimonadaceae bacterium]
MNLRVSLLLPLAVVLAASTACRGAVGAPAPRSGPDSVSVLRDVRILASDALEGRGTGTPGNDSAAAYIARRFASVGAAPAFASSDSRLCPPVSTSTKAACDARFVQPFVARSVAAAHAGLPGELPTQNVAALVRGTDPALRDEYIVLGAHFDHLGRSAMGALDPDAANAIHNGADDNASGTAAVIELARLLRRNPAMRSVIFVAFSGEELGLLGSQYFVDHLPVPIEKVRAMLNFDMVGRLRDDRMIVYGVETASELKDIVDRANAPAPLQLTAVGDGFGASDHSSFYAKNLPVLHFFTNVHDDYHKASDDAEKINAGGIARVVAFAERITREIADRPQPLTFVRAVAAAPTTSTRENTSAYLGSIPDMGATDVVGVRLTGVRADSPADRAGLKPGDVIVEFGGKAVKDLYGYTDALYGQKPGDVVNVVVLRGAQRMTVKVTLGRRGA